MRIPNDYKNRMIPKVLHYCWFGPKPKPETFVGLIETWRRHNPDYEIREWNESNFNYDAYLYSREAYRMGCYAHVSDVCRIHALYFYGGVYLDTDIEVVKPFDSLLKFQSFVGVETRYVGTGVIGAEAQTWWIGEFLKYYDTRHFINPFGHPRRKANTAILTKTIIPSLPAEEWPLILPADFLSCKDYYSGKIRLTDNTFSIHHYDASWRVKSRTLKDRLLILLKGLRARYRR